MDGGTEGGRRRYQNRALSSTGGGNREAYMQQGLHWLEHDSVALAVLVIGIGMVELLALPRKAKILKCAGRSYGFRYDHPQASGLFYRVCRLDGRHCRIRYVDS